MIYVAVWLLFVLQMGAFIIGMLDGTEDYLKEKPRSILKWAYVFFGYLIGYKIGKYLSEPINKKGE